MDLMQNIERKSELPLDWSKGHQSMATVVELTATKILIVPVLHLNELES